MYMYIIFIIENPEYFLFIFELLNYIHVLYKSAYSDVVYFFQSVTIQEIHMQTNIRIHFINSTYTCAIFLPKKIRFKSNFCHQ